MRLIAEFTNAETGKASVYYDSEWQEYVVRWFNTHGVHLDASDYHTDDKEDALSTARLSLDL